MWWSVSLELLAPLSRADWALVAGALVVFGVALLALEILVIPGFGVTGVAGILSILGGGAAAWSQLGAAGGMTAFGVGIGASLFLLWLFPRTSFGKKLALDQSQRDARAPDASLSRLVGAEGVAITPLRPAGAATFGEERVDVVTDGVFVEAGVRVRVEEVEGARVVVEPIDPS